MTTRAEQRELTRARILEAAIAAFADHGFDGAATRDIAARADTSQGLVTYHFGTKGDLWRAAADHLFNDVSATVDHAIGRETTGPDAARESIRAFVRLNARRPELFRFMVDAGRQEDFRMRYLVDTHLRPWFAAVAGIDRSGTEPAHLYYSLAGAASLLFGVAPECRALTGVDPEDGDVVERHADYVADLFVPAGPQVVRSGGEPARGHAGT